MVRFCASNTCANDDRKTNLHFFRVPDKNTHPETHQKWTSFAGKDLSKFSYFCESHFTIIDFVNSTKSRLKPDAYPTIQLGSIEDLDASPTHVASVYLMPGQSSCLIKVSNEILLQINVLPNKPKCDDIARAKPVKKVDKPTLVESGRSKRLFVARGKGKVSKSCRNVCSKSLYWKSMYFNAGKVKTSMISKKYAKNKENAAKRQVHQFYREKLGNCFTNIQIDRLLSGKRKKWTLNEIALGLRLKYSTRTYEDLRSLNIPLPGPSTLREYLAKIEFKPGILEDVLKILKQEFIRATPFQRQAVLMFDEMAISPFYDYFLPEDRALGGKKNVTVFLVRGYFAPWKQIFAFDFCEKLTKKRFLGIVAKLEKVGLVIRTVVCDMGPKNRSLWKSLGIGVSRSGDELAISNYIEAPVNNNRICFQADVPHLVKLVRNHMLATGLCLDGSSRICKQDFEELLRSEKTNEFKKLWKLTPAHLDLSHRDKMKVTPAVQLFSHETAEYWREVFPERIIEANFIDVICRSFNVMTSRHSKSTQPDKMAFGKHLGIQTKILNNASQAVSQLRVIGSKWLLPFQMGYLITIKSIQTAYQDMHDSSMHISYMYTGRSTQDAVENVFSCLRAMGPSRMPTAVETIRRIKLHCISTIASVSRFSNTSVDQDEIPMISVAKLSDLMSEKHLTTEHLNSTEESQMACGETIVQNKDHNSHENDAIEVDGEYLESGLQNASEEEAFEYVLGFVAKKLSRTVPQLSATREEHDVMKNHFIHKLKRSTCVLPSTAWRLSASKLNKEFIQLNGEGTTVSMKSGVLKQFVLFLQQKYSDIPPEAISLFAEKRLKVRCHNINEAIKQKTADLFAIEKERVERLAKLVESLPDMFLENANAPVDESEYEIKEADSRTVFDCDSFSWSEKIADTTLSFLGMPLRETQKIAINAILTGLDVIVRMPTGSGKSAIFQIPTMAAKGYCLIISPLVALIENQIQLLNKQGVKAIRFYDVESTCGTEETDIGELTGRPNDFKFMYVTPEKLAHSSALRKYLRYSSSESQHPLEFITIDEAHCYHEWSKSFRKDYQKLASLKGDFPKTPIIALSATLTHQMISELKEELHLTNAVILRDSIVRENLKLSSLYAGKDKDAIIIDMLMQKLDQSGIIYCGTIRECEVVCQKLETSGISCACFHSKLHPDSKKKLVNSWISGAVRVIISTTAFGMGIHKDDCGFIIHYNLPHSINQYVQQFGRAGRNGEEAECYILISLEDTINSCGMVCQSKNGLKELHTLIEYSIGMNTCRWAYICESYDEDFENIENCKCDNCLGLHPTYQVNAWEFIDKALKILKKAEQNNLKIYPKTLLSYLDGSSRDKEFAGYKLCNLLSRTVMEQLLLLSMAKGFIGEAFTYGRFRTFVALKLGPKSILFDSSTICEFVLKSV